MSTDNLSRLGLESVDSFNCEHGEGFYFVWNTSSRIFSIQQQVALLTQRGLEGDASLLATRLKNVGYYCFSACLHPFRVRNLQGDIGNNYVPGTTLDEVWAHYLFDRKLRFLMMDAIERIEVALRSRIAYHHTANKSPFDYASPAYFPC